MSRLIERLISSSYLFEDKLDDWTRKYGKAIPGATPEAKRSTLLKWASYDPTYTAAVEAGVNPETGEPTPATERKTKFLSWMLKQSVIGKAVWDDHSLDHVRDLLTDFVRFCTMPAFTKSRDISTYDYITLGQTISANGNLLSKKQKKAGGKKVEGGFLINTVGNLELYGFKDGASLAEEAWLAYDHANPNWTGKNTPDDKRKPCPAGGGSSDPVYRAQSHYKTDPEYSQGSEPVSVDGLWCIRKPERGGGYASGSPSKMMYVVRKDGWPYLGMVWGPGSQIHDLENHGISVGGAAEIYDLVAPLLDEYAAKKWDAGYAVNGLFAKLRLVNGGLKDGDTIEEMDLAGVKLKSLPENLTVNGDLSLKKSSITVLPQVLTVKGDLNISGCKIAVLPPGVKVSGKLNISNTRIAALPEGLTVGSIDITGTPITTFPKKFMAYSIVCDQNFDVNTKLDVLLEVRGPALRAHHFRNKTDMSEEQKASEWVRVLPKLKAHALSNSTMKALMDVLFVKK